MQNWDGQTSQQLTLEETTSFLWVQRTCQIWAGLKHLGRDGVGRAFVSGRLCWFPCPGRRGDTHQGNFCSHFVLLKYYISVSDHITACMHYSMPSFRNFAHFWNFDPLPNLSNLGANNWGRLVPIRREEWWEERWGGGGWPLSICAACQTSGKHSGQTSEFFHLPSERELNKKCSLWLCCFLCQSWPKPISGCHLKPHVWFCSPSHETKQTNV